MYEHVSVELDSQRSVKKTSETPTESESFSKRPNDQGQRSVSDIQVFSLKPIIFVPGFLFIGGDNEIA